MLIRCMTIEFQGDVLNLNGTDWLTDGRSRLFRNLIFWLRLDTPLYKRLPYLS